MKKSGLSLWWVLGLVLCTIMGFLAQKWASSAIKDMRQMERVPNVSANHLIPGEVSIHGKARQGKKLLKSRYTKTPCLYHRFLKQREERDSEGDTRWVTVESGSEATDFFLSDKTGKALVKLSRKNVKPDLSIDFRKEKGKYRYSEWRIEEGENIYAFAVADEDADGISIRFDLPGSFSPILSNAGALENRSDYGTKGVLLSALSLSLFCFACLFVCFLLRIHRVLIFLSIVSFLVFSVLIYFSLSMMHTDLLDGFNRLSRLERSANKAVEKYLGESFDWSTIDKNSKTLGKIERDRVLGIRDDFLESIARTNSIRNRFPERLLAPIWGIKAWPVPIGFDPMPGKIVEKTPMKTSVVVISIKVSLILILLGAYFGFRRIKTKRYIENIPTSLSSGLAYGPSEIKGKVNFSENISLKGPETGTNCVYYRHKITEKRTNGKKTRTVVIKDESHHVPFFCKDREGMTLINPEGAEITAALKKKRKSGVRTYYEWHLAKGDELYLLGSAVVDEKSGDRLMLSDGKDDFPFLISDESETETMLRQSRKGLFGIGVAQNCTVFLGFIIFGALGSFAATDFLFSATLAPFFLAISMFILMYNDLIFLRNRVKRAWANIEVSLKKRCDLIPNLEKIVKAYLSHEKEVLASLAELRNSVFGKNSFTPAEADVTMNHESVISNRIFALKESYPDLKSNEMIDDFMNRLARMENEVSMMRSGYNDGVERYRSAKQRFPEVILSKLFRFEDHNLLSFSSEIREIPNVNFEESNQNEVKKDSNLPNSSDVISEKTESDLEINKQPETNEIVPNQKNEDENLPKFYVHKKGNQYGPYSLIQIREYLNNNSFSLEDFASWDGQSWKKISQIPNLNQ